MELKKCPQVEYCIDGKFSPRCANYDYDTDICSGRLRFKCAPYTELEFRKLDIYWKCMD